MAARKNPPEKIKTGKEMKKKVLALVKAGKSNAEILAALGIGRTTLGTLKEELRGEGKLPAYDRGASAKAAWARRNGEEVKEKTDKELKNEVAELIKSGNINAISTATEYEHPWVIVRCAQAGVFFGQIVDFDKPNACVRLTECRRLWYWDGAASLSELAVSGTKRPKNCKFTVRVADIAVLGVIEVIMCEKKAAESINGVPEWKA